MHYRIWRPMAKQTKKGRSTKGPKHVQIIHYMIDSPAWLDMGCVARSLFVELQRRFNGHNNGNINLGCREAATHLKVSKNTAAKAFKELVKHGFIKVSMPAGFSQKVGRSATRWTLTNQRMSNNNHGPTDEWKKWAPENLDHGHVRDTKGEFASRERYTNGAASDLRPVRDTLQPKKPD